MLPSQSAASSARFAGLAELSGSDSFGDADLIEPAAFSVKLHGRNQHAPWDAVDWDADPDWEWHSAAQGSPEYLMALWQDAVSRSRALVAAAVADGGLVRLRPLPGPTAGSPACAGSSWT